MELNYYLMRKDTPITVVVLDESGVMLKFSQSIANPELAPLQDQYQSDWLKRWWSERSVPVTQGKIGEYLREHGYNLPSEYLVKNLGLSLTDYYWLKPINSELTWNDVNLFDNAFTDNLLIGQTAAVDDEPRDDLTPLHFSPNGSLQGSIEKTWAIRDGERYMVKGNKSYLSAESINEVIACRIHELQGYRNYAPYDLLHIHHKEYDYGCCSKLFTSQQRELVSAWAIYTNQKKSNNVSSYEHFLKTCEGLGVDIDNIRREMDYQILTDFVMSGYDRHLNNIALLRDADSLKFIGVAPIYDSGGSLFANRPLPKKPDELLDVKTEGFARNELGLLKLVSDPSLIDLDKLPAASYIREMYHLDSQADDKRVNNIACFYEKKIELCRAFQLGKDLKRYMARPCQMPPATMPSEPLTFHMLCGVIGSGKSHAAREIADKYISSGAEYIEMKDIFPFRAKKADIATLSSSFPKVTIISADAIRHEMQEQYNCVDNYIVFDMIDKRLRTALSNNVNVIYDATNLSAQERRHMRDLALEAGAGRTELHITPLVCKNKAIDASIISNMKQKLLSETLSVDEEQWDLIEGIHYIEKERKKQARTKVQVEEY